MSALSTRGSEAEPAAEPAEIAEAGETAGQHERRRHFSLGPVLLGAAAILVAVAVPLAPVRVNDPVVTWPADPEQTRSTLALFMPYRPLGLDVDVPCQAIRSLGPRDAGQDAVVFSTYPPDHDGVARGLTVLGGSNRFRVTSNGQAVYDGRVPDGDCSIHINAFDGVTSVRIGRATLASKFLDPPRITAFVTDLSPDAARGLRAVAHADARFESSPTAIKRAALVLQALLVVGCLAWLWRNDRAAGALTARRGTGWSAWRPRVADLAVVVVLGVWAVIGPLTDDDGFYATMARQSDDTGFIGNYFRWFNAPEAPFSLVQRMLTPWVDISPTLLWLRMPSVLAVLAVWAIVTRGVLPTLLQRPLRTTEHWLAAIVLLAWALPYGIGVRPEPWVALASIGVLALIGRGLHRRRLLPIGVAALVAAVGVSITPSGLIALTPFAAFGLPIWRLLRERPDGGWRAAVPVVGCVTLASTIIFSDASLAAVQQATRIHDRLGPAEEWWEEFARYTWLFSHVSMGSFAKRLPVLVAFAVLLLALVFRQRATSTDDGGERRAMAVAGAPALALALAFGALWFTPSKWTHHFGSLIGLGTVVTVVALADLPATLRSRRVSPLAQATLAAGLAVLVALAFAGPNGWYGYSQFGIAFDLASWLSSPLPWLAAAAVLAALSLLGGRDRQSPRALVVGPERAASLTRGLGRVGLYLVVLALVTSVVICVRTFTSAAVRLDDTWTIARGNLRRLDGRTCGMGDFVQVATLTPLSTDGNTQPPAGSGFRHDGAVFPPPVDPAAGELAVWGTYGGDFGPGAEWYTGRYTTPWFDVPALDNRSDITLLAAGRLINGNALRIEFSRDDGRIVGAKGLGDFQDTPGWRELVVVDETGLPAGATRLRFKLLDGTVGTGGWLAVTGPRLRSGVPLSDVIGHSPALVDWPIAVAFPCLRLPTVQHGMVEPPAYVLNSSYGAAGISRDEGQGGTFLPAFQVAKGGIGIPTRVEGFPDWMQNLGESWGVLTRYDYPYPTDGYRVDVYHRTMRGTEWD